MKNYNYRRFPCETIERIIMGDAEAMTELVKLYMPYIKKVSRYNQDIEDRVISKLMRAAI